MSFRITAYNLEIDHLSIRLEVDCYLVHHIVLVHERIMRSTARKIRLGHSCCPWEGIRPLVSLCGDCSTHGANLGMTSFLASLLGLLCRHQR